MNPDQVLGLSLTVQEINGILHALGGLPFNQVAPLIGKIKQQADQQLNIVTTPPEENHGT